MTKGKTILVSGANGFLGSEVVSQLLRDTTYRVIALTSQPDSLSKKFENTENLQVAHIDSWEKELSKDVIIDVCLNCAFPRSSDPAKLAQGLKFTEKFIKDVIAFGIPSIINISSQSVYSQQAKAETAETAAVAPESVYGMAKYASERIVSVLANSRETAVNYTNIRLASLTGRTFEVRMTNRFVKQALAGEQITIQGGTQKIAYLEVRDAAAALIKMLETDERDWQQIYNLGTQYESTVIEIAEAVKQTAKHYGIKQVDLVVNPGSANFNNLLDSRRFYADFNWKPAYTIPLMIEDLFSYYHQKA